MFLFWETRAVIDFVDVNHMTCTQRVYEKLYGKEGNKLDKSSGKDDDEQKDKKEKKGKKSKKKTGKKGKK